MQNRANQPLHTILVADTYPPRREEMVSFLTSRGKASEVISMDVNRKDPESAREDFGNRIRAVLEDGKSLCVIMNYFAGIELGFFEVLRRTEIEMSAGTRRLIVTCVGSGPVKKGLTKEDAKLVRRIPYDGSTGEYLGQLDRLL